MLCIFVFRVLGLYKLIVIILQFCTIFFRIVDCCPPLPVVFPYLGFFHVNMCVHHFRLFFFFVAY